MPVLKLHVGTFASHGAADVESLRAMALSSSEHCCVGLRAANGPLSLRGSRFGSRHRLFPGIVTHGVVLLVVVFAALLDLLSYPLIQSVGRRLLPIRKQELGHPSAALVGVLPGSSRSVTLSGDATGTIRRVPVLEEIFLPDSGFPVCELAASNWDGTGEGIGRYERRPQRDDGCKQYLDTSSLVIVELILDVVDEAWVVGLIVLEFMMCGLALMPSLVPIKCVLHVSLMQGA